MNPIDWIRRVPVIVWWAIGLAFVAGSLVRARNHLAEVRAIKIAEAKHWDIRGPACPTLGASDFLKGRKRGPRGFTYKNVRFLRRSGYADCAGIFYDGGRADRSFAVCQFTSPGQLMVRTSKGTWYFEPGPGQPATVSTAYDEARCVLNSHVTLATVRAQREAGAAAGDQ